MKNLCSKTQCEGFQLLRILDLWGGSIHAVVVFGLGKDFLFKSTLGHCEQALRAYCPNMSTVPDDSSNFFLGTIWILFNIGIVVANSVKQQVVPPGFLNFPNPILDVIVHTCQIHHLKHKVMPSL